MKRFHSRNRLVCALLLRAATVALLAPAAVHAQGAPGGGAQVASASSGTIEEVTVTAERRVEKGQNVPIVISVFTPKRLEQQNIVNEQGLAGSVPSLVVGPNGNGSREAMSATIRGQGTTFEASPAVVEYFDEVPLPSAISLSQQGGPGMLFDLDNIQVLEGPQGTLFGRNTTGGAILFVPKKPTDTLSGYVQAGTGNYDLQDYEGAINIPVVEDKLMIRASGMYYDRDGYTRDVLWHLNRDNAHWYTGRFEVLFRPTSRLEDFLLLYGTRSHDNGSGLVNKGFNIPMLQGFGLCGAPPLTSCNVYTAATAQQTALGPRKVAYSNDAFEVTRTWGAINKTEYDLNDNVTLRNIVSYQWFYSNYAYDGDATVLQQHDDDAYKLLPPGVATLPYYGTPITYSNTAPGNHPRDLYEDITEEFQVQGTGLGDMLNYTVGAFYYLQEPAGLMEDHTVEFCPGLYTGSCGYTTQAGGVTNRSKALYAQASLDLGYLDEDLAGLRLTGGYRYTWDTVAGWATAYSPSVTVPGNVACAYNSLITVPAADGWTACYVARTLHSTAPSWMVSLDYKLRPDLMVYGKVSHSYKSGGFNPYAVYPTTWTFAPEYDTTYEAGFKSDMPLGSLPARLNADYFYTDYSGIQRAAGDYNPTTFTEGAAIRNASARIQGVEVSATIRPFEFLELGGNFSYTDAKYKKYQVAAPFGGLDCAGPVAPGGTMNLSCLPFQYVSPRIYNVNATIDLPIPKSLGDLSFFINYAHNSEQYTDAVFLPAAEPGANLEPYGLLNMSLNWTNILGHPVDLSVFVTNATDKLYRISNTDVYNSLGYWSTLYGTPRMFGFKLRYRFGD